MTGFWRKGKPKQTKILEDGWQFQHTPNALDNPPGRIFRIDSENTLYPVTKLDIKSATGKEAVVRIERQAEKGIGILTKLLDIGVKANVKVKSKEKIEFELTNPEKEITEDMDVDKVLKPFSANFDYLTDNRYYIVRAVRWASAMTYRLSKDRIIDLGGEAEITKTLKIKGNLKINNKNMYEIPHEFPERMIVMFLPEEIKQVSAGLGGKGLEFGRVPVNEQLEWKEN